MVIIVILHDFEDENLIIFESFVVEVYQKPEEIKKFAFVECVTLRVNIITDQSNKLIDLNIIVQHIFVIVVHLFEEVQHSDVC